jgi:hypothetical protein
MICLSSACQPVRSSTQDASDPDERFDREAFDNFTDDFGPAAVQDFGDAVNDLPNRTPSLPGQIPDELDAFLEGPWNNPAGVPAGWQPSVQAQKVAETLNGMIRNIDDPQLAQALGVFRDRIKAEIAQAKNVKTPAQQQAYQARIKGLLQKFLSTIYANPAKRARLQQGVKNAQAIHQQRIGAIKQKMLPAINRR